MAKLNADMLDDLTIKAAKPTEKQYTLRDGNGLFLLNHPNGSKYFQLRTTLHGKPKLMQLLERLLEGEIKARFASNVVQHNKFSELLANVIKRYQNRSIETAQVMEELIEMAKKFKEAADRGG